MTSSFEKPSHSALLAEQERVQAGKFQGRQISEYNSYIFNGQDWREARSSAVTDFVRSLCDEDRVTLEGVIRGLYASKSGGPIHWVDMGGGRGLAMRQVTADSDMATKVRTTNVDLINYGIDDLNQAEVSYLEGLRPGMLNDCSAPDFIYADSETVNLNEPAELITAIETIQYLNDPLAAICNWYNQLADGGLLIISAEQDWSSWIRYQRESGQGGKHEVPTQHFFDALEAAGVPYAACYESDTPRGVRYDFDPSRFRNLVVQKKPETQISLATSVQEVWTSPFDFKAVYYRDYMDSSEPIVRVENSDENYV